MDHRDIARTIGSGGVFDITTTGRRSGLPRRIEVYVHNFDGDLFIGGRPGFTRDWLANLTARPDFTVHLAGTADVAARAEPITNPVERRRLFYRMLTESWGVEPAKAEATVDRYVVSSPLVRVTLDG